MKSKYKYYYRHLCNLYQNKTYFASCHICLNWFFFLNKIIKHYEKSMVFPLSSPSPTKDSYYFQDDMNHS